MPSAQPAYTVLMSDRPSVTSVKASAYTQPPTASRLAGRDHHAAIGRSGQRPHPAHVDSHRLAALVAAGEHISEVPHAYVPIVGTREDSVWVGQEVQRLQVPHAQQPVLRGRYEHAADGQ
eukprot:scaffold38310_cov63-Phaeocystis_antarctica.AAC.2